jgi:hypothetical protein
MANCALFISKPENTEYVKSYINFNGGYKTEGSNT